jgi:hypothetical protein
VVDDSTCIDDCYRIGHVKARDNLRPQIFRCRDDDLLYRRIAAFLMRKHVPVQEIIEIDICKECTAKVGTRLIGPGISEPKQMLVSDQI